MPTASVVSIRTLDGLHLAGTFDSRTYWHDDAQAQQLSELGYLQFTPTLRRPSTVGSRTAETSATGRPNSTG